MECPICKNDFVPKVYYAIYCSNKCGQWAWRHLSKEERSKFHRPLPDFDCRYCGKHVYVDAQNGDKRTVFCSHECEKKWWRHPRDYGTGTRVVSVPKKYLP